MVFAGAASFGGVLWGLWSRVASRKMSYWKIKKSGCVVWEYRGWVSKRGGGEDVSCADQQHPDVDVRGTNKDHHHARIGMQTPKEVDKIGGKDHTLPKIGLLRGAARCLQERLDVFGAWAFEQFCCCRCNEVKHIAIVGACCVNIHKESCVDVDDADANKVMDLLQCTLY